jgi:hypothetical protein
VSTVRDGEIVTARWAVIDKKMLFLTIVKFGVLL